MTACTVKMGSRVGGGDGGGGGGCVGSVSVCGCLQLWVMQQCKHTIQVCMARVYISSDALITFPFPLEVLARKTQFSSFFGYVCVCVWGVLDHVRLQQKTMQFLEFHLRSFEMVVKV